MAETLFAHTANTPSYPGHLNVSIVDGVVQMTVRGPAKACRCGETVSIRLDRGVLRELTRALVAHMARADRASQLPAADSL